VISFFKKLTIETLIIIVVGIFPFLSWGSEYWFEFLCAFSVSLLNAVVGYCLALYAISKTNSDFYRIVYGGMLVRMAFVLGFTIYMITQNFVEMIPFFLSLMIFYVIHQWTEIFGWLKELPTHKVQTN
tara:strand:- start:68 stop:451 length:384 start_codon:yes stop_codon:yes gene_type:complete